MPVNVTQFLQNIGVFTIGAGLITVIARYAIKQYFDKELKGYQSELDKEQVRFSDLHTTRAEVISEVYSRLIEFDEDVRVLTHPAIRRSELTREEEIEHAGKSGEEFRRYCRKHMIYFSPETRETMEQIISQYQDIFHDYSVNRIHEPDETRYNPNERIERITDDWESVTENEVPELKSELEEQFQDLLGVKQE